MYHKNVIFNCIYTKHIAQWRWGSLDPSSTAFLPNVLSSHIIFKKSPGQFG